MTTGNTGGTSYSPVTPRYKETRYQLVTPFAVLTYPWVNFSASTSRNVNTKTWSGANRVKYIETEAEKQSRTHRYTIPRYRRSRSASGYTFTQDGVTVKSFRTRPIPKRVRNDVEGKPNAYSVVWNYIVDGTLSQTETYVSGTWKYVLLHENVTCNFRSAIPNMSNVAFTANEDLTLINKLKSRIRGSDFDLSVFIGEGHDTLRMLSSQMTRLAEAGWYARKGNLKAAMKVLAAGKTGYSPVVSKQAFRDNLRATKDPVARNWLELQYGMIPLLSDVKAGAEQLSHLLHYPKTKKYTAKTKIAIPLSVGTHSWEKSRYLKSKRLTAYIKEPENLATISGILDPEVVMYQLVPFSFIGDWIIPVSDWLEARAFASKLSATFVTTSTTEGMVYNYQGNGNGRTVSNGANGYGRNYCNSTRVISTTLAVPKPAVKTLAQAASWMHVLNAAALVQAIFGNSRKVKKSEVDQLSQSSREFLYGVRDTRRDFRRSAKQFL